MDIEGAHENPDQDFPRCKMLSGNVVDGCADALLDADDLLLRFHDLRIDNGAVCGAKDPGSGRRISWGIPKKPNVTPKEETKNEERTRSEGEAH